MPNNIYPANKTLRNVFLYGGIIAINLISLFIQGQTPEKYILFFLSTFTLLIFSITELFDIKAGMFAIGLGILLETLTKNINLAVGYLLISGFYFFIRGLRNKKISVTVAREKHFRSLVNVSLQPMIIKNKDGEVLFASDSVKDLLGIKKKFPTGKHLVEFIHYDDRPYYEDFLKLVLSKPNEKKSIELRVKKSEDGFIWARIDAINLLGHPDVTAIVTSWQDITFQKTTDFQQSELLKNEREARTLAEKAVRDRDEFLSIASHELKTPLTSVLLQLQATLRKILTQSLADFSGRDLLDSLQIAEKQSQSLSTLIKDLLNVSIASTGRLTLTKDTMNLGTLVDSLVNKYSEEIKISGCAIIMPAHKKEIVGIWDPVRIEQALTNLLMNALKYAKGKTITMETNIEGPWAVFTISDTGSGIPTELQGRIFEPFQRANGDSSIKGLGVGLFITKQIAVSHGGNIEVVSKSGKGTTFKLWLPLQANSKA